MQGEFEISLKGKVTYFLRLQIKQAKDGTFIRQMKYFLEFLKNFDVKSSKSISTPLAYNMLIDNYESVEEIDITKYNRILTLFNRELVCVCVLDFKRVLGNLTLRS